MKPRLPRLLVAIDLSLCPEALEELRRVAEVDYRPDLTQNELKESVGSYDAFWGHTNLRVDESTLSGATRLRVLCTATTGTDHIDVEAVKRRGIELISLTTEYELLDRFTATAELAWALLLACRRRLPALFDRAKEGEIGPFVDRPLPWQLSGKVLGIVGYGRLGKMVGEYGKSFRMRVLAHDVKPVYAPGIEAVDFDTLVRRADVITLHVHLRKDTYHMIDNAVISRMKPGVTLINVSRGDLIREQDLLEALESGHIAAAGLDVVHNEWDSDLRARPLLEYARTHDNLVLTPHVGGATVESIAEARVFVAKRLVAFLSRNPEA